MLALITSFLEDKGGDTTLATLSKHLISEMGREEYDVALDGAAGRNKRGGLSTAV